MEKTIIEAFSLMDPLSQRAIIETLASAYCDIYNVDPAYFCMRFLEDKKQCDDEEEKEFIDL